MKIRFAVLALMAVAVVPLSAQGGGGRRNGGGAGAALNIDNLTTLYKLTADQKTKAEALIKTYNTTTQPTQAWMASERQAGGAPNADSLKKITDARATFDAAFKALLTDPQVQVFDSVQKVQASRRRGGGGGGGL
jgi:hypothetical protein